MSSYKSWAQQVDEVDPIIMSTGNTNKPAVVESGATLTDTLVRETQQGVNDAQARKTTRAENAYGKTIDRGGQTLGIGFVDAIVKAYTNIVYSPVAMALMVISTMYYVGKLVSNSDSTNVYFLCTQNVLKASTGSTNVLGPPIAYTVAGVCSQLHKYGDITTLICAVWFPYFAKPSQRNGVFSSMFTFYFAFNATDYLILLVFSHTYYLFTQIRAPSHKAFIVGVIILACMLGPTSVGNFVQVDDLVKTYGVDARPVPPPTKPTVPPTKPEENPPPPQETRERRSIPDGKYVSDKLLNPPDLPPVVNIQRPVVKVAQPAPPAPQVVVPAKVPPTGVRAIPPATRK